jgi:non-specific serine/threonine protein kinase
VAVELVSLSDPKLVPSAIASVLGLKMGGDEISPDSVARAIGGKKLLLVLDNCEHVVEAAAWLAETLVSLCPYTSILATEPRDSSDRMRAFMPFLPLMCHRSIRKK